MKSLEKADALFKEELPKKIAIQDVWLNQNKKLPQAGRQLEAADEGGTLIGRLSARMASRDLIDELDMGPKGRSPESKKAQVADSDMPYKMFLSGNALVTGKKIEEEHKKTVDKLKKNPKIDKKKGLQVMEEKLNETADWQNIVPSKMMIGPGQHTQTDDKVVFNMSDPIISNGVRPGSNMAEQAKNAGNVFNTMRNK